MYSAIEILEKALYDSMQMQSSPAATSYVNQLKMAINLLKRHTAILEQEMDKRLELESKNNQS